MKDLPPFQNLPSFSRIALALVLVLGVISPFSSQARIIDGLPTGPHEFPEVVSLYYPSEHIAGRVELCTGTLIHPKIILTSAHCVPENPATAVTVNEGTSVRAPTRQPRVAFSVRHENYSSASDPVVGAGFDFGIVVLHDGIDDVLPAQLGALATPNSLEVVGFGGSRKVGTDMTTGIQRRAMTRALEIFAPSFSTEGPVSALSIGDSGGPAFLADGKRPRQLVGVASGVPKSEILGADGRPRLSSTASVSLYARIRPAVVEWIEENSGYTLRRSIP